MEENNNDRIYLILLGIGVVAAFIFCSIYAFRISNIEVLIDRNFENMVLIDKKVNQVVNAHNAQVDSWYAGNKKINKLYDAFFSKMRESVNESQDFKDFEDCVGSLDSYMIYSPHIAQDLFGRLPYVDGYMIDLYDVELFDYQGKMVFTDTYAGYQIVDCGLLYYDYVNDTINLIGERGEAT